MFTNLNPEIYADKNKKNYDKEASHADATYTDLLKPICAVQLAIKLESKE